MSTLYPITGLALLAIVLFAPHFGEKTAKIYWRRHLRKKSCYEQARFLYALIRYYHMFPEEYTAIRSDRLKTYMRLYAMYMYPSTPLEKSMQLKMFDMWYQLKDTDVVAD